MVCGTDFGTDDTAILLHSLETGHSWTVKDIKVGTTPIVKKYRCSVCGEAKELIE